MIRRGELEHGIALDAARVDIASRLKGVCEEFAEQDFVQLVERIASIEVKYRLRDDLAVFADSSWVSRAH